MAATVVRVEAIIRTGKVVRATIARSTFGFEMRVAVGMQRPVMMVEVGVDIAGDSDRSGSARCQRRREEQRKHRHRKSMDQIPHRRSIAFLTGRRMFLNGRV